MLRSKKNRFGSGGNKQRQWLSAWGGVFAWCLLLFVLSGQSGLRVPGGIPEADKVTHLLMYGILGWLWGRAIRVSWSELSTFPVLLSAIVFTGIYGLSDEWHQSFVPGRAADLLDAFADGCGGTLGGAAFLYWSRVRENGRERVSAAVLARLRNPNDFAA